MEQSIQSAMIEFIHIVQLNSKYNLLIQSTDWFISSFTDVYTYEFRLLDVLVYLICY